MMKSRPDTHSRLVRKCDVDQGRPMEKVKKGLAFIINNRQLLGAILGSTLVLLGYVEEGNIFLHAGE